ncbi:MAG: RodZ domain-containing protein [Massilia sp.]
MSTERADTPAVPASQQAPGQILAAQREAMGWSVEQVADQLKMAVRQVIALEAGDYAALPGSAVVRGFVRAYAKIVKLDPAPLVAMIAIDGDAATHGAGASARGRDKPASFSEVRFPTNGKRKSSALLPVVGVLIVLGAAAGAAWKFGLVSSVLGRAETPAIAAPATGSANGASSHVTALPPPPVLASAPLAVAPLTTVPTTGVPAATGPSASTVQNPSVPLISVPPPSAAPGSTAAQAGVPPTATAPAAAAAPAAAGPNPLVVSVREDSWIEIRPAKGAPLIARLVKAGTTETFELSQPASLVVGKPDAVSATLRGAPVALPLMPGKNFSRVNLK